MKKVKSTLRRRGEDYGDFWDNASISQRLKTVLRTTPNWERLGPDQKEALELIASRLGRLLNGDCNNIDEWHDIAGYAELVAEELKLDR